MKLLLTHGFKRMVPQVATSRCGIPWPLGRINRAGPIVHRRLPTWYDLNKPRIPLLRVSYRLRRIIAPAGLWLRNVRLAMYGREGP